MDADLIWEGREMASKAWKANQTRAAMKKAWEQKEEYEVAKARFEEHEEARRYEAAVKEAKEQLKGEVCEEVRSEVVRDLKKKMKAAHRRRLIKKRWVVQKKVKGYSNGGF